MSLLPLADYSDDDEDEPVAQIPAQPAVPPRVNRDSPGPLTPSRDNTAGKRPASGLVKLRHSEGQRGTTPTFESAVTPSAASEASPGAERAPSPSFRDVDESISEQGESKRNEILRPRESIELPGEPEGSVDPQLQAKMEKWTELRRNGTSFNGALMNNKGFRNPSIMNKLIEFLELDEYGSNYPKEEYDPRGFHPESFLEELGKAQARKSERAPVSSVPSAMATRQIAFESRTAGISSNANPEGPRKKSKWDSTSG